MIFSRLQSQLIRQLFHAIGTFLLGLKKVHQPSEVVADLYPRGGMSIFRTMQSLNALPLIPYSPHTRAAARHCLKRHNNRTDYQVCGPFVCRASAAVSDERITNGKARPMTIHAPQQPCEAGRLTDDGTAFLEEHRIRGYEVGPDQKTTIVTIANLLQVCCSGT